MNKKLFFRTISLLVAVLLMFSFNTHTLGAKGTKSAVGKAITGSEETVVASNEYLSLYVDPQSGIFRVINTKSGIEYYSNPKNYRGDSFATGVNRTKLGSQLLISCVDEGGTVKECNSAADSISKNGLSLYAEKNGYLAVYNFPDYGITVELHVELQENSLITYIDLKNGITEKGKYAAYLLSTLPYFGCSSLNDNGYIFVPDGPGGIINFNNQKQSKLDAGYNVSVYGNDLMQHKESKTSESIQAVMPVFGMHYEAAPTTHSFLAIITQGEALAQINANVAGAFSGYNNVYPEFTLRGFDTVSTLDRTWAEKEYTMVSKTRANSGKIEVTYSFQEGENSDLSGMAAFYWDYLKNKGMEDKNIKSYPVYLDLYMGVKKKKQFLGFVYNGYEKLTDFNDAKKIADDFTTDKTTVSMRTRGLCADGAYYGKINSKFSVKNSVGGIKEYKKLESCLENLGGSLYNYAEIIRYTKTGNGFSKTFDSAVAVTNKKIQVYEYRLSNLERRLDIDACYLLSPHLAVEAANKLSKSYKKHSVNGVSPGSLGQTIYSAYNDDTVFANQTQQSLTEALEILKNDKNLMLENAAQYAFLYGDELISMPTSGGNSPLIDSTVPFLYMALHGKIPYSCESINMQSNIQEQVLRAIECGASPMFSFYDCKYGLIKNTVLEDLYSGEYDLWKKEAIAITKEMSEVLSPLCDVTIENYIILNSNVKIVIYENGTAIAVNYSDDNYNFNGTAIPAKGYKVLEGYVNE